MSRAASLAIVLLAAGATRAGAQSASPDALPEPPSARHWFELSAGVAGTSSSWSSHSSLTAAIVGDMRENGYRLRIGGGYGDYRYTRPLFDANSRRHRWPEFFGEQTWVDVLVGYQWAIGSTTVKAFAGLTEEQHRISPGPDTPIDVDDENLIQGQRRGTKLVLETWTRLADWGFLQSDAAWSEPFDTYGARIRLGYVMGSGWSTGLEASAFRNISHDGGRAGAFARYDWQDGEASFSAGFDGNRDRIGSGYSSVAVTLRF